jgi:hypothetical protein
MPSLSCSGTCLSRAIHRRSEKLDGPALEGPVLEGPACQCLLRHQDRCALTFNSYTYTYTEIEFVLQ